YIQSRVASSQRLTQVRTNHRQRRNRRKSSIFMDDEVIGFGIQVREQAQELYPRLWRPWMREPQPREPQRGPRTKPLHVEVRHGRGEKRECLGDDKSADHCHSERLTQVTAGAEADRNRQRDK